MEMCYDGALVMPSSYAVMNEEEMTYVEGGKFYGVNLTAKQCANVSATLNVLGISFTITSLCATVIGYIPGLQAALAAAKYFGLLSTVCTISGVVFDYCSRNNGMSLGFESSTKKFVYKVK